RIQRAASGTRTGAISTSTTAAATAGPGSPVRVRATDAAANPSSTLPASASPVADQGSASPRVAAVSITSAPAASGASNATVRILVRRKGPVGVKSTTRLAGSSRVNPGGGETRTKETGNKTGGAAGNAAPTPPPPPPPPAEPHARLPRPGPQHRSDHHVTTAWVNPPVPASTSMIRAAAPA